MALALLIKRELNVKVLFTIRNLLSNQILFFSSAPVSTIDEFTTQLVKETVGKWIQKPKQRKVLFIRNGLDFLKHDYNLNVNTLSAEDLENRIMCCNDKNKLIYLLGKCIKYEKNLNLNAIKYMLQIIAELGDVHRIYDICNYVKKINNDVFIKNCEFKHYVAEATWYKGDIVQSLEIFKELYRNQVLIRRDLKLILRNIIFDVPNKSQATLIQIIQFCETISNEFQDCYLLICLWRTLFLSEWHSDQQAALDLLENNPVLCKMAVNIVQYVVIISLKNHQTDPVYRLLEILLEKKMKFNCGILLSALFEYRYQQRDLNNCSEIVKWSLKTDIALPKFIHEQFLQLLVDPKMKEIPIKTTPILPSERINYKF